MFGPDGAPTATKFSDPMVRAFCVLSLAAYAWRKNLCRPGRHPYETVLWGAFVGAAIPWGSLIGPSIDPLLTFGTAWWAKGLVNLTGGSVELVLRPGPGLLSAHRLVNVTGLCAGIETFLGLWTLAGGVAVLSSWPEKNRLRLLLLSLPIGICGNMMRIVASTHVAQAVDLRSVSWVIAHDGIAYAAFAFICTATYLAARPGPSVLRFLGLGRGNG